MKIKVCGLKDPKNMAGIAALHPDYMGFIFYRNSPRFIKRLRPESLNTIPASIKKTGVFVNDNLENILTAIRKYGLDAVQLHGAENQQLCSIIKEETNIQVIKAFPIMDSYNLKVTKEYEGAADVFLFDTKTDVYGGSGQKFNWNILYDYQGNTDFLLSGGISIDDVKGIRKLKHPRMIGIDINSRFEIKPGLKNVPLVRQFIQEINNPLNVTDNEQD